MAAQQGIPLNEKTLATMGEEERGFWEDFLSEASDKIDQARDSGATQPFQPTESLRTKYQTALSVYEGEKYCQVSQLKGIFAF